MRQALIKVEGRFGRGNVVRCGALAQELKGRGWDVKTATRTPTSWNLDWNPSEPFALFDTAARADVIVQDFPSESSGWQSRSPKAKMVMIVDVPGQYGDGIDLLVAGGAGAIDEMYKDCEAKRVLAGPQYALLRPEFLTARAWRVRFAGEHTGSPTDLRILPRDLAAVEIAALMAEANVAITYGGMRAMECACVGTPIVVMARNKGERLNAMALTDFRPQPNGKNTPAAALARSPDLTLNALFPGLAKENTPESIADMLLTDPLLLTEMSAACRALVDGLGCQRVADAIGELCR